MKKPSLDAIRRFKEQQERKKQEETEKKIQEKLSILEHRAAQGDRKAKIELKSIEKAKEERNRLDIQHEYQAQGQSSIARRLEQGKPTDRRSVAASKQSGVVKRPKKAITDFDELMRLAASNNNQIRPVKQPDHSPPPPPPPVKSALAKKPRETSHTATSQLPPKPSIPPPTVAFGPSSSTSKSGSQTHRGAPMRPPSHSQMRKGDPLSSKNVTMKQQGLQGSLGARPPVRPMRFPAQGAINSKCARNHQTRNNYYDEDDDDDYEDEYEQDDFVVDDDDGEAQAELSKTIKSVFGYDRRRCDLREAELDRQYRQIGRVSTFEDLEREERRASRLAAVEDARAAREEEERKRLKKIRMKGY